MTIKKAIIIGTLCAIGATLTTYAIKKGIDIKPKTITAVNADSLYTQKNQISTDALSDGFQFNVNPYSTGYNSSPQTFTYTETEQPTNYENTTWQFKPTINADSNIDIDITFTNGGVNYIYMICDGQSMAWVLETDPVANNPIIVYDNNAWTSNDYRFITITENTNNTYFKNWLWNNTIRKTDTYYANTKHEEVTNSYVSIEYTMMNQKTKTETSVKNEGLFFIKIQSIGVTNELTLENALFLTDIPNMYVEGQRQPNYTAKFKISKAKFIPYAQNETNIIFDDYKKYETIYDEIANKTNIYSGTYTANGVHPRDEGTYSNETGERIATFSGQTATSANNMSWIINEQRVNIYSQGRANFYAVYYSNEVSNFGTISQQQHSEWYSKLYNKIGYTSTNSGYAIASVPVTPPDIEDGNFMSLSGMILNILTLPFTFLSQAFDLTLWANTPWAFNIKNAIFVMIGIFTFLFIIKLFTRGFDSLGNYTGSISKNRVNRSQAKLNKEKAKLAKRTDPNTKTRINKKE